MLGHDHEAVARALAERSSELSLRNVAIRYAEMLDTAVFLKDK